MDRSERIAIFGSNEVLVPDRVCQLMPIPDIERAVDPPPTVVRAPTLRFTILVPSALTAPWKSLVAVALSVTKPPSTLQPTSSIAGAIQTFSPR